METATESFFIPEMYQGFGVDIVHRQSLERVANGQKQAELEQVKDAQRILRHIQALEDAGITLRMIEDASSFEPYPIEVKGVKVGGAFVGQCMADYQEAARKAGYQLVQDPILSLR